MCTESVMPPKHLILCCPLLFLPSMFPSTRVFPSKSALHIKWPKYWSFSFNINPFSEYSGLISFRTDWFDLLAVQGTVRSLLQHHNSAFFMVQLSNSYMTTGKTIALTIQTITKVIPQLFITLSRFVIAFLQRSQRLLISWLQSLSIVILEPKKIKSVPAFTFSPSICH